MDTRSGDDMSLDERLSFALYRATQAINASCREHLSAIGLTCTQFLVMLVLWAVEEASVGQLSSRLGLDSGTLTPLLKRLEQRGLIIRRRALEDERVVRVCLTDDGRDLFASVTDARRKVAADTGLSRDAIARLRRELHRLSDHLEAIDRTG